MKACALLLGTSALALGWCGTAAAQNVPPADSGTEASASTDSEAARDDHEIVITATRRSENLMTTAISGSVLSGNSLEEKGVNNVDALQFATPSVVVNNFGQGNDFNIRGIGKAEHNTQTTTGVITYRDGVPSFPGYFQMEPYFDVANIQVLRGPQGTIVGQNATGGAVFVNTMDPIVGGGVHGYLQANYGNYNDLGAEGAVNLPVAETFAARIAFYGERRDGFYDITGPGGAPYNGNNGDLRIAAGRLSLLWKPTDRLSILSKTDLDYLDQGAYPASPFRNFYRNFPIGSSTPNPTYSDLFDTTANSPQGARDKFLRSILRIEYALESGLRFRSVSAYQKGNTSYTADLDGTATGVNTFFDSVDERQISQEFNIISPDDKRFTWLLGAFALWNKYYFLEPFQFVIGTPPGVVSGEYKLQGTNPTRSLAAFGQVGFLITPNLKLEVGGRYTASRSTNHVDIIQYGLPLVSEQTAKSDDFSYKVSLGWKLNPYHFLYAFVATGFRPGGLNVPVGLGNPAPFGPEKVRSYEAGWKANFAGGHVRTTLDAFYNDYRNFQVIIGYPAIPVFGIEVNVPGSTKIYGVEAEAEFSFGDFSLDLGISAIHSELGQFFATDPRAASFLPCDPVAGPASVSCLNLGGREQTYAPEFTFNAGAQYEFTIGDDDKLIPRVNFGHVAAQWATLFQNRARGDRLPARNILNAQLAWKHDQWEVTAYTTNLTNQHYPGALNTGLYFAGPPRQYGLKVRRGF